jgi:hypothetical protein
MILYRLKELFKFLGKGLLKVGRFIRIIDEKEVQLSIVNLACIIILFKLALSQNPSVFDLGALLLGLLAHYGKKQMLCKTKDLDDTQNKQLTDMQNKIKDLGDRIGGIAASLGFKNLK